MISFLGNFENLFFWSKRREKFEKKLKIMSALRLQQSSFGECFGKTTQSTPKNCRKFVKSGFYPIFWGRNTF
jgi:hypothetical protein